MHRLIIILLGSLFLAIGCNSDTQTGTIVDDGGVDGCHDITIADIASDYRSNAWKSFAQLTRSNQGNVVYSPLSLQQVLGMILAGSKEDTYAEISTLLDVSDLDLNCIGLTNYELIDALTGNGQLSSISAAYYDGRFTFDSDYANYLETYYDVVGTQLPFADPGTVDIINEWANEATEGRIDNLLDEVQSNEVLLLLHALHLQADWQKGFYEQNTQPQTFTNRQGETKDVTTMFGDDMWHCARSSEWQIATLPTRDSVYSLTCLSPISQSSDSWLAETDPSSMLSTYMDLRSMITLQRAQLHLPKFAIQEKYILNEDLKALGMVSAFDPLQARLQGLGSAGGNLYVSRVIQDVYLSIDENGIEGAAATLGGIAEESAPPVIRFDNPFVIVVEHIDTGVPVFMGLIGDPAAED